MQRCQVKNGYDSSSYKVAGGGRVGLESRQYLEAQDGGRVGLNREA